MDLKLLTLDKLYKYSGGSCLDLLHGFIDHSILLAIGICLLFCYFCVVFGQFQKGREVQKIINVQNFVLGLQSICLSERLLILRGAVEFLA